MSNIVNRGTLTSLLLGGIGVSFLASINDGKSLGALLDNISWLALPFLVGGISAVIIMLLVQAKHRVLLELIATSRTENQRLEIAIREQTQEQNNTNKELHKSEMLLIANEIHLKEAQRIALLGSWHHDLTNGKTVWSEELFRMYGFDETLTPPEFYTHKKLFTKESWQRFSKAITSTSLDDTLFELELETVRKDGSNGAIWVRGERVLAENGTPIAIQGVAQDITDRKNIEAQLQQSQKLESIGKLVAGVAHDFNNILAVALGNIEFLQSNPDDPDREVFITQAHKATVRGAALTKQLLAFGRRSRLDPKSIVVGDLLTETRDMVRRVLPANIEINTDIELDVDLAFADVNLLQTALLNLAINASDSMPHGGRLTFGGQNQFVASGPSKINELGLETGNYVVISVIDDGTGMDDAVLAAAFEPFFTTKPVGQGSGLGLSMVQGFSKQSGGSCEIVSCKGKGTTVKLYLPIDTSKAKSRVMTESGVSGI